MKKENGQKDQERPPIVVVLGHVDHGKTTLLDKIRNTNVFAKEAGGITQSIGASVVNTQGSKKGKEKHITFIDTPGHAAFSNMRSRGAKVADIAILVVAADDGVKPQTKEALEYILASDIAFIVAATKIDLPSASVDTVRTQLEAEQVLFEGRGGDVPLIGVSGKTGKGIDELLEMILLVAELNDVKGKQDNALQAVVIETSRDKRGPLASVVVRDGSLKVGDQIVTDTVTTKVRALFDYNAKSVKEVKPGYPAQILGFSKLPEAGSKVWHLESGEVLPEKEREQEIQRIESDTSKLNIVLKAKNAGSLEALIANIPDGVQVVHSSVGDVIESDVFLAKSASANVFVFESKVSKNITQLAKTEGVKIKSYNVIYELFDEIKDILESKEVKEVAKAKIIASFPFNGKSVAGCKIVSGSMSKKDNVMLRRGVMDIGLVKVKSIRKQKQDIEIAKEGEECGILFTPQLDFKAGDVLVSLRKG